MAQLRFVERRVGFFEEEFSKADHEKAIQCSELEEFFTELASVGISLVRYSESREAEIENLCRRWLALSQRLKVRYSEVAEEYQRRAFDVQTVGEVSELTEQIEDMVANFEMDRMQLTPEQFKKFAETHKPDPSWYEEDWEKVGEAWRPRNAQD